MAIKKRPLSPSEMALGFLSTPLKHLSTFFDGPNAWEDTGCDAVGTGRPVREAQHSTDGLFTVDVAITEAEVNGELVPNHRYVRLEVMPGTAAHRSLERRRPGPEDLIRFGGPLVWDKDKDKDHLCGHMEVHPLRAIEFVGS